MQLSNTKKLAGLVVASLIPMGCGEFADFSVDDVLDNPVATSVSALKLAGVTPAHDFRETGNINFSVLPEDTQTGLVQFANLHRDGMKVEVKNEDGTYSECEHAGGEEVEPSPYQTVTLLLDGSGSMELAYPPSVHGDVCVTCPHDPKRRRVAAAKELVERVHGASAQNRMAAAEFGPEPTHDYLATRILADFGVRPDELQHALNQTMGYEPYGTPLYDSLAEMIGDNREEAKSFEATLRRERGEDVPWEEKTGEDGETTQPEDDVPQDAREVGRYIVVLSDGIDNESEYHDLESTLSLAIEAGVRIYAVGLGPASASSADPDRFDPGQTQAVRDLQKLARDSGGYYAAANNPAQLESLYDALGQALTQGYQVETYSCVPKPAQDTPEDECDPPPVGSRVDGRLSFGEVEVPWVTVAN